MSPPPGPRVHVSANCREMDSRAHQAGSFCREPVIRFCCQPDFKSAPGVFVCGYVSGSPHGSPIACAAEEKHDLLGKLDLYGSGVDDAMDVRRGGARVACTGVVA